MRSNLRLQQPLRQTLKGELVIRFSPGEEVLMEWRRTSSGCEAERVLCLEKPSFEFCPVGW